jgi:DNA repair protein RecN (Recombination protein N)
MLRKLRISNFAIIENVELEFQNNLTTITGETGSGKSILLGALNLLLGERADYSVLRDKNSKTIIEGEWQINEDLRDFFEENDLDFDASCIIRREIIGEGKSRAFINDSPVNLNLLKGLTSKLIHIHSQHNTLELRDKNFQLSIIDILGTHQNELKAYHAEFTAHQKAKIQLKALQEQWQSLIRERDFVQFQIEELAQLDLEKTNYDALIEELHELEHAEVLIQNTGESIQILEQTDGVLLSLNRIKNNLQKIAPVSKVAASLLERITIADIELKDILAEMESFAESITIDPNQMDFLNNKLESFQKALRKHQLENQGELNAYYKQLLEKNLLSESLEFDLKNAEKLYESSLAELKLKGTTLSDARKKAATQIGLQLLPYFNRLKLNDARVAFKLTPKANFDSSGFDHVDVLFSTNQGIEPQPIEKVASGGELGRLMLILMTLMSERKALPTVIFDEIDTGVSGDVADRIGQLLREMGKNRQLLTITHLPQVAAAGHHHLSVRKTSLGGRTVSNVLALNEDERKQEIAQLLSGENITNAAIENAKTLLTQHD